MACSRRPSRSSIAAASGLLTITSGPASAYSWRMSTIVTAAIGRSSTRFSSVISS